MKGGRLEGRVAYVTGAGAGIGRATARLLAERIAFLLSEESRAVNGNVMAVDGTILA